MIWKKVLKIVQGQGNYQAHPGERIEQHIDKCCYHFDRIIEQKELRKVIERNLEQFDLSDEKGNGKGEVSLFLWDAFYGVIGLHDIGKINPMFQKKLGVNEFASYHFSNGLGSNHSYLSAILYLDVYLKELDLLKEAIMFDRNQYKRMIYFLFLNAYIISRHHSNLTSVDEFIREFEEGERGDISIDEIKRDILPTAGLSDSFLTNNLVIQRARKARRVKWDTTSERIGVYVYHKLLFSLLLASDYYATSEQGNGFTIQSAGVVSKIKELEDVYNQTPLLLKIREYEQKCYCSGTNEPEQIESLNDLRSELFLDVEKSWNTQQEKYLYFLEAPTGIGKSNTALNLSFQMIDKGEGQNKIFYIYPYNTLVEQNEKVLRDLFQENENLMDQIHVINSVHSILGKNADELPEKEYQRILLDRQFLNYPITLSTHVTLFDIMFGDRKESNFSFHQLVNSVIVLDEIQSYKNSIWTEIITFFSVFAKAMNIRFLIMSATLPDLSQLTLCKEDPARLMEHHEKYYQHSLIKNRSRLHFELLEHAFSLDELKEYVFIQLRQGKKVLVEFIKKKTAEMFYEMLEDNDYTRILTGDDNVQERKKVLNELESCPERKPFLLIATQVIEAGVDLNGVEVGFKDTSIMDSEEQFMGRINRSCDKEKIGDVFFFSIDRAETIYKNDVRTDHDVTLPEESIQTCLKEKNFSKYYEIIMNKIRLCNQSTVSSENIEEFFGGPVERLDMRQIEKRMRLIEPMDWQVSIFFHREIVVDQEILVGEKVWNRYKELLLDTKMDYAKREVLLQDIRVKMNYFIYQVSQNTIFEYDEHNFEQLGELYYVQDSEDFFVDGRFSRAAFEKTDSMFF